MQDIFETITLIVLFILKIRDIVAQNFELPIPRQWKWLIYNRRKQEPVLCSRIYERSQTFNEGSTIRSIIERLLIMDGKHIKKFPDGYFHRHKFATEIKSEYFINTLEASYIEEDLNIMTLAIRRLLEGSGLHNIDFVLFLKNGNQMLAQNIFREDKSIIYICKIDEHSSYVPQGATIPIDSYSIQYENLDRLLHFAKMKNEKLTGVAIDCSISTGEGLKDSINHFNNLLKNNKNLRINKIKHAFILYCHKDFDDATIPFKLHRYFDMDEEVRKMIFEEIAQSENKALGATHIYKYLKKKKRIRYDL